MLTIAGIGEALFDVFPNGQRKLGGATLNFSVHAHQLLRNAGGRGMPVTRIGVDALGNEVVANLDSFGIDTAGVQWDAARPTGQVVVSFSADGQPDYDIVTGVAWDAIEFNDEARSLASKCDAVCFGTLAQRDRRSASAIQAFVEASPPKALRLCDINLRQSFFSEALIRRSLELANAAKLNSDELAVITGMLGIGVEEPAFEILARFELNYLILTRGERGTSIYTSAGVFEGERVSAVPAADADPVGAGDACAAACTVGLLLEHPPAAVASFANRVGAFVASQPGGTPRLPNSLLVRRDGALPAGSVSGS